VVDTSTGTVKVTIEAVRPPAEVRPGGFVNVKIVRDRRPDAVLVPRESVVREMHDAHVFIAHDGRARKRAVTLGLEEDGFLEAVSGVDPGEKVVIAGQGGLKDGSPIKVLKPDAGQRS
jgi:membrane fusion protein (multidrug efflux system)